MLNKKAIAALAAGATLVSGLAFATPSFAADSLDNLISGGIANSDGTLTSTAALKAAAQKKVKAAQKKVNDAQDDYNAAVTLRDLARKDWESAPADKKADKKAAYDKAVSNVYTANDILGAAEKELKDAKAELAKYDAPQTPQDPPANPKAPKLDLVNLLKGVDEPSGATMVSPFGTSTLYTNYKGLTAELIKKGLTNIAAYDALLDKLEFGLKQTGWANILKNMGGDNCNYLGQLRRQLQKAVKHYGHVEAAVKDIQAELNEDKKDELAKNTPEGYKNAAEIQVKLNQAGGLLKVADNNRTRAAAVLDSANHHAKDLSCDTGAKEVLDAMKKAGNFPGKKTADKKAAPAGAKLDTKIAAAAVAKSAALPKTGVAVMVTALAASMLAGIGAAVRKFRH